VHGQKDGEQVRVMLSDAQKEAVIDMNELHRMDMKALLSSFVPA